MSLKNKIKGFDGILVIGDVHGNFNGLKEMADKAQKDNLFLVSLGDLIDYGVENFETTKLMHRLIKEQRAQMVIGNHDLKFSKWIKQMRAGDIRVQVKGGLVATINEYDSLNDADQHTWDRLFLDLMDESRYHYVMDNLLFVHAGATADMWYASDLDKKQISRALYGQLNKDEPFNKDTGYPNRIYDWRHDILSGHYVLFGHDIIDTENVTFLKDGTAGGVAVSVDTGSSKGGTLSGLTFTFNEDASRWDPH